MVPLVGLKGCWELIKQGVGEKVSLFDFAVFMCAGIVLPKIVYKPNVFFCLGFDIFNISNFRVLTRQNSLQPLYGFDVHPEHHWVLETCFSEDDFQENERMCKGSVPKDMIHFHQKSGSL
ncbi:hypothetical protein WA026_010341 [Henosepilachna vigintioctopunctata]|uniref:Uncharacterized protein n=1 Tax=Henosepilachna vigintioctopunctata TaxID=420089 RepID=A0AAW1V5A7_9CUCU